MTVQNPFLKFHALGYQRLVPVVPHNAEISEKSSLHRALNTSADPRGKAVGVKGHDGKFYGFDWVNHECSEEDIHRWGAMGCGVGIKTGNGLVMIDADTKNTDHARVIRDTIQHHGVPLSSVRIGNYPKAGYVVRTDPDYRYTRIEFGERDGKGRLIERVEILSEGRQFVAHGIHPTTKRPYEWPKGIPAYEDLPFVPAATLDAILADLKGKLPAAGEIVKEGGIGKVDQASLKGDLDAVRRAVAATPNNDDHFPTREDYVKYGYAIKAALQDYPDEAFDLFSEWSERWQTDRTDDKAVNKPDAIASDWARLQRPYRVGANWLYETANKTSGGQFGPAHAWFEALPDETITLNPFDMAAAREAKEAKADVYSLLSIDQIVDRPPPTWLVKRHIPKQSVGFIYSKPGAGKTFITLDMALSIACGLTAWQGDEISGIDAGQRPHVVYIAAEGSYGFRNRVLAWLKARGISRDQAKSFLLIEQTINFMSPDDVGRLLRTLRGLGERRPCLVVVDTVSRALPGADENLQKDMTVFIRACDAVKEAFGCAVIGVHHAGKSGDMRGSTVLLGAGDFVFRLERKAGSAIGVLECEKQKDGEDGWNEPYRFDVVGLGEGASSLVVERVEQGVGPSVTMTPDLAARVLSAMASAWEKGEPWARNAQSKERYAVRRMVADFGFAVDRAEDMLSLWEQTGIVETRIRDNHSKLKGLYVLTPPTSREGDNLSLNDGIFE